MKYRKLMLVPVITGLMVSCAQDTLTGDVYSRNEARSGQSVQMGRITQVRYVKIEGGNQAGSIIGAIGGGLLGSSIGNGRASNTAGAVGGAALGSALGSKIQQSTGTRQGIEITVRLDNGQTVAVVQEENRKRPSGFEIGQSVRVLNSGNTMRVAY
jgi:outer membrane lipoprotein SlyB